MSIESRVHDLVRGDPFLYEAFGRGILNNAGVARWLQENKGLEAGEDTITEALRKLESEDGQETIADLHPVLHDIVLGVQPRFAGIIIKRTKGSKKQALRIFKRIEMEKGEVFHMEGKGEEISVILERGRYQELMEILDEDLIERTYEDLTGITFKVESEKRASGLVGLVLEVLSLAEIEIIAVDPSGTSPTVFLRTSDQRDAIRCLDSFGLG